jgi:hypothetical protein
MTTITFSEEQVAKIFENLCDEHDIFYEQYLFENINWTEMKSVEEFRDQLVQCIQNKKIKVDILQVIKDSLYGCFKNDQMTVQLDETNDGAFLSIVNWDVYGDDQPESLFIPKEKKNDFILYLKNMIERLEKL